MFLCNYFLEHFFLITYLRETTWLVEYNTIYYFIAHLNATYRLYYLITITYTYINFIITVIINNILLSFLRLTLNILISNQ